MRKKSKKGGVMRETELPRPELYRSYKTGNIVLRKENEVIYIKVVSDIPDSTGKIRYYPVPGAKRVFKECSDLVYYSGPIDDGMIVNLLIFG